MSNDINNKESVGEVITFINKYLSDVVGQLSNGQELFCLISGDDDTDKERYRISSITYCLPDTIIKSLITFIKELKENHNLVYGRFLIELMSFMSEDHNSKRVIPDWQQGPVEIPIKVDNEMKEMLERLFKNE